MRRVLMNTLLLIVAGMILISSLSAGGKKEESSPAAFKEEVFWTAEGYDYDALVKAAQAEGSLVARWQSGRAPQAAEVFEKKYGIKTLTSQLLRNRSTPSPFKKSFVF